MSFTIETPTAADADAVSQTAEVVYCATFRGYPEKDLREFLAGWMPPAKVAAQLASPEWHYRVIRDAEGVAGFIKLGAVDFDLPATEPEIEDAVELHQLYMQPRIHGTGAAAALMEWALGHAREMECNRMYLSVFIENLRAQAFYRRYGFYEVGKNPFRVGTIVDDDRIWRLDL